MTHPSHGPYAHLRAHAATQKRETVERLACAIAELEAEGRPVTTFTIREVSGLDYMTYYRNREAFQLFQEHSTHLRKEREQAQAKHQVTSSAKSQKPNKRQAGASTVNVSTRDPLLDYKRPRLVALVHEARAERDEARRHLRTKLVEAEQRAQAEQAEVEQRYGKLLQEHAQCGQTIARLEAELAQFRMYMEGYRSSLQRREQET